jgi:arylformamidase
MRISLVGLLVGPLLLAACDTGPPAPPRPRYIVDLSPPLDARTIELQYGRKAAEFFGLDLRMTEVPVRPANPMRTFGFTRFEILSHAGAHLDAAARLLQHGDRPMEIPLDKLFGWSRVLDLRWHDRTSPITVTDLENYRVRENEIIILNVGYEPPTVDEWPQYAYLSEQAAYWLAAKGIRALATDMPSISDLRLCAEEMDRGSPPQKLWPAHLPFFEKAIPVVEGLVHLDQLLGERRVYFAGFPLPLTDRSGAPVRAVAMLFD